MTFRFAGKRVELHRNGVIWDFQRYLYWWNPLPPSLRYWGYHLDTYDGPMPSFGLWFCNITWRFR